MSQALRRGLFIFFGILLLGLIILMFIPTPEESNPSTTGANSSATPANMTGSTTTTTSGSPLGNLANNTPEFAVNPTETTGVIEGSFTYLDSNEIPEGTKVCAVNQTTFAETCTSDLIPSTYYLYGTGYRLELPPGEYTVYAQAKGEDYRAYYTPYVLCGQREECQSHTPIRVTVTAAQVTEHIDPQDWSESPDYN